MIRFGGWWWGWTHVADHLRFIGKDFPACSAAGGRVPGLAAGVAGELRGAAHLGPARRAVHRVELRMRREPGPGLVRVLLHLVRHQRVQVRETVPADLAPVASILCP